MNRISQLIAIGFFCLINMQGIAQSSQNKSPNILFICIDDLRPELNCFGATYIHSPNIDKLASEGVSFMDHFVNAPSCGPSRYTLLTGTYGPAGNMALFQRAEKMKKKPDSVYPSMPEWFRSHGYITVSVGKVSHHPGGYGGEDWDDSTVVEMPNAWTKELMPVGKWQHPRGAMHGLANGEIRNKAGDMSVYQSTAGPDTIYPDGLIANEGIKQLRLLAANKKKPFFLAIGLIKPHLPFGSPKDYLDLYRGVQLPPIAHPQKPEGETTWHKSGEFMGYNRWGRDPRNDAAFADSVRRHYASCVSYSDMHVGEIMAELKRIGADKNTIVILWGDHGWHLGEHAIWGKHSLFEESLRSPLIIRYPGMKNRGKKSNAIIETLDIFPTLCQLTNITIPSFAKGVSLKPILENPKVKGHTAVSYWGDAKTLRTLNYRLTVHKDGFVELYDHTSSDGETQNIAIQNPDKVKELKKLLDKKIKR